MANLLGQHFYLYTLLLDYTAFDLLAQGQLVACQNVHKKYEMRQMLYLHISHW